MAYLTGNQFTVLKEGMEQIRGKTALKQNIEAIRAVAEAIKTTLGPRGLNKMIVDTLGDIVVSNDGAKILEELGIENPTAKMVVDLSKTIHKNVGDGVSSGVIFIGELMKNVDEILEMDISPTMIYEGFSHALRESKKIMDKIAQEINTTDIEKLKQVVFTALSSKNLYNANAYFSEFIVEIGLDITEKVGGKNTLDMDNIQIIKKEGESIQKTRFIKGIIIDKEIVNPTMPKIIKGAKISLIDAALEIIKTDFSAEIQISSPEEIDAYIEKENNIIKDLVDSIKKSGANVVFCQKGIDEAAQHYLSKYGIIAIRRVKHSDMVKLAKATGAQIITQIKSISSEDLGEADSVLEQKIGKDNMIFVEGCHKLKSATVLIRGGTEHIVDDGEIALKNGFSALKAVIEFPKVVGGAGSLEIALRRELLKFAQTRGGKEQIAIEKFADSLEIIPRILVENSGLDSLDYLTTLRAKCNIENNKYMGIDTLSGKIVDTFEMGIIDPLQVKKQLYSLATELAIIFIRIDDYIRSSKQ